MTTPHLPVAGKTQQRSNAKKTVLLWLCLIVMFLAIYQLFSGPTQSSHHHSHTSSWDPTSLIVSSLVAALLLRLVFWGRATNRFNVDNAVAETQLARGQVELALAQLVGMRQRYRRWRSLRNAVEHNLARVELRQGKLDSALDRFAAVANSRGKVEMAETRRKAMLHLAIGYALKGDVTAATAWLGAFDKWPGALCVVDPLARALIELRRGHYDAVARDLETRWRELEQRLTGDGLRPLRVVRAFAVAHGTSRDAEAAPALLQPLGQGAREELRWLGAGWPELQQFIDAHL
jgi:hypothetical protein